VFRDTGTTYRQCNGTQKRDSPNRARPRALSSPARTPPAKTSGWRSEEYIGNGTTTWDKSDLISMALHCYGAASRCRLQALKSETRHDRIRYQYRSTTLNMCERAVYNISRQYVRNQNSRLLQISYDHSIIKLPQSKTPNPGIKITSIHTKSKPNSQTNPNSRLPFPHTPQFIQSLLPPIALATLIKLSPSVGRFSRFLSFAYRFS
jgi:hypothetical protein